MSDYGRNLIEAAELSRYHAALVILIVMAVLTVALLASALLAPMPHMADISGCAAGCFR